MVNNIGYGSYECYGVYDNDDYDDDLEGASAWAVGVGVSCQN